MEIILDSKILTQTQTLHAIFKGKIGSSLGIESELFWVWISSHTPLHFEGNFYLSFCKFILKLKTFHDSAIAVSKGQTKPTKQMIADTQ